MLWITFSPWAKKLVLEILYYCLVSWLIGPVQIGMSITQFSALKLARNSKRPRPTVVFIHFPSICSLWWVPRVLSAWVCVTPNITECLKESSLSTRGKFSTSQYCSKGGNILKHVLQIEWECGCGISISYLSISQRLLIELCKRQNVRLKWLLAWSMGPFVCMS